MLEVVFSLDFSSKVFFFLAPVGVNNAGEGLGDLVTEGAFRNWGSMMLNSPTPN